jgi:hypothetical protein
VRFDERRLFEEDASALDQGRVGRIFVKGRAKSRRQQGRECISPERFMC